MAIGPVVTRGFGSFGTVNLVLTRGYTAAAVTVPTQAGPHWRAPGLQIQYAAPALSVHWQAPPLPRD